MYTDGVGRRARWANEDQVKMLLRLRHPQGPLQLHAQHQLHTAVVWRSRPFSSSPTPRENHFKAALEETDGCKGRDRDGGDGPRHRVEAKANAEGNAKGYTKG